MPDINKPMDVPELNLQPPITSKVRLSEDMQQTLALLCAMGISKRVLLRCSESGILLVTEPVIDDVIVVASAAGTGKGRGGDIPCSSAMIMAHPLNTSSTLVRPYKEVDGTHGWPLDAKDVVSFAVDNLNRIYFLCAVPEEGVVIAYTR